MKRLLVCNARLVNEDRIQETDILIENGRIAKIAAAITPPENTQILDVSGKTVFPGMIDDQVHFRDPGMPHKADMISESRAAVAGGITSFMDMPNTKPQTLTSEILEDKYAMAAEKARANYAFYFGAANDNLEHIQRLDPKAACGIKVFMGASTGNMLVDDPKTLEGIFRDAPTLIATHCEDSPMIKANEESYRKRYGEDVPFSAHPLIRSEEACLKSSTFAVGMAKKFGSRLHVLHISTAKELELFTAGGDLSEKQITAEACVHFLHFADEDYLSQGSLIKCNPAIKTAADRDGIVQGIIDDKLDVIGTDHAPHTWEEKQNPYFKAPSGLPLVQHAFQIVLEHYFKGRFSLEMIARKTSHNVADLFAIEDRGYVREGYWADLTIVDMESPFEVKKDQLLYRCGWSPFEGHTFRSSIFATVVNGQIAYQAGKGVDDTVRGQRLRFKR